MAGLFTTPQEVAALEAQQRAAQSRLQSPLGGSFFNLGHALGGGVRRGVGQYMDAPVDTRSKDQINAAQMQQQLQGLDFTDRKNMLGKVRELSGAGLYSEAAQLMKLIPDAADVEDQWSQPYTATMDVTDPDSGNMTKQNVMVRKNLVNGKVEKISHLTSSGEVKGGGSTAKFSPAKIDLSTLDIDTQAGFLMNMPGIEGEGFLFDNYDAVEARPMIGDMSRLATTLKNRDKISIHKGQAEDISLKTDQDYLLEASKLMMEDPEAWYSKNTIGEGAKPKLRSNKRVTIDSLTKMRDQRLKRETIIGASEQPLTGGYRDDVRPSETRGVFNLNKVPISEALSDWQSISDPKQLIFSLQDRGWNIDSDSANSLMKLGTAMVAYPDVANNALRGGKGNIVRLRQNLHDMIKANKVDASNAQEVAEKIQLLNELEKLNYGR